MPDVDLPGPSPAPIPAAVAGPSPHLPPSAAWVGPPYRPTPAWAAPAVPRPKPRPAPFRSRELGAALAAILAVDLALFAGGELAGGGFGLALFFVAVPATVYAGVRARRPSTRLLALTGLLAAVALRCAYAPTVGAVLVGLALLFGFTLSLRARHVTVPDALASAAFALGALPSRVAAAAAGVSRLAARTRVGRVSVLPIVVPVLLCALFAHVFALANPLVSRAVRSAWSAISSVLALPSPGRLVVWALAAAGAATLLRPSMRLRRADDAAAVGEPATPTAIAVARNALLGTNLVFLACNALDAAYLWAGTPPPGLQTQRYAHEGAFWLTVALVLLTVVVGVMFRGALADDPRARTARGLAYAWIAQGLVLAGGTYGRIGMHIHKSGLSDLRIVGILGTTSVVVGVVAVALKVRRKRTFGWLLRRQLDALTITAALYTVAPTHLISAHVNVARIASGEYRPLLHMFRQSAETESAAALLPLLRHHDVRVRQGVAALLERRRERLRDEVSRARSWQERDLASARTLAALEAAAPLVEATLGDVDRDAARLVLLEISRASNEDRSIEEILAARAAARGGEDYVL